MPLFPFGQSSEETNPRKSSLVTDLFNFLLITSDPIITRLRPPSNVSPEAIHLLDIENSETNESNEEEAETNQTSF